MPETTSATTSAEDRKSCLAGRVAQLKWFSVFAALLIATAIDGMSIFESNRVALETASIGRAVASRADDARPDLMHEVSATGSIDAAAQPAEIVTPICPIAPDPLKS